MAYYKDGFKHPNHLWECVALHRLVRVECKQHLCGNVAIFDPADLFSLFHTRRWNDAFSVAVLRFYCRPCSRIAGFRVKNARLSDTCPMRSKATHHLPFSISDTEWKNFLNRHRG